jgi:hypothetical protein
LPLNGVVHRAREIGGLDNRNISAFGRSKRIRPAISLPVPLPRPDAARPDGNGCAPPLGFPAEGCCTSEGGPPFHRRAGELDRAVVTDLLIARSRRRWMLLRPLPSWRPGIC